MEGIFIGKFSDQFQQIKRMNRRVWGRQKHLATFPWYSGDNKDIIVSDAKALDSDKKYKTEINSVGRGYDVGLQFELAGKKIITGIVCPKCGSIATLNIHWPAFQCTHDNAMWEICK